MTHEEAKSTYKSLLAQMNQIKEDLLLIHSRMVLIKDILDDFERGEEQMEMFE